MKLLKQIMKEVEQVLMDRIKYIGDGEHTYIGHPANLLMAIEGKLEERLGLIKIIKER